MRYTYKVFESKRNISISQMYDLAVQSGIDQFWIFFLSLPSTSGTAQPSELPGAVNSLSVHALQEICPSASLSEIQSALAVSNGNADEAAQQLLGNVFTAYYILSGVHWFPAKVC